jgi:hypothetical protein
MHITEIWSENLKGMDYLEENEVVERMPLM